MKDLSLWEEILLSLRFNDSIGHNIFLVIVFLLGTIFVFIMLCRLIYKLKLSSASVQYVTKSKSRSGLVFAAIGFWMLIFPLGLFLLINVSLARESNAAALDKAFLYKVSGKPVAAMVIEKFNANETDSGITSGNSFSKIEAIDLESGKLLFDKKLKGFANTHYKAKILCASEDNLFLFFDGQIIAVDKITGKTVRSINSLTNLSSVSLLPSPEMCKFDQNAKTIIFKANNGIVYSLDIKSFSIKEKTSADASEYFKSDNKETVGKSLGNGIIIDKASENDKFNMFLTESDIKKLKEGLKIDGSRENTERRFLYSGNLNNLNELKKISQEVFLLGGFLFKDVPGDKYVYSSIDVSDKNFQNYVNIATRGETSGEAFRVDGSNLSFIVHKKSLNSESILVTAIDLHDGKIFWTLDTGAREIHECYAIDKSHILLFCENKSGSMGERFDTNSILYVSIKDGSYTGYDFKYDRSF